jgi:hypothetical protein
MKKVPKDGQSRLCSGQKACYEQGIATSKASPGKH